MQTASCLPKGFVVPLKMSLKRALLLIVLGALMGACIAAGTVYLVAGHRADRQVQKQLHPDFPKIALRTKHLPDIFTPVLADSTWFSDASTVRDLMSVPGGFLLATDGGLVFARPSGQIRKAGRSTGLPFTAVFGLHKLGNRVVAVGKTGLVFFQSIDPDGSFPAHATTFARPLGSDLVDAVVDGEELYLLTRDRWVLRLSGKNLEKRCRAPEGIATVLGKMGNRFYVGTVEGKLFELTVAGNACRALDIPGLEGAGEIRSLAAADQALWIGAADGLFLLTDQKAQSVRRGLFITALEPDERNLWIGTFSGRVYLPEQANASLPDWQQPLFKLPEPVHVIKKQGDGLYLGGGFGVSQAMLSEAGSHALARITPEDLGPLPENYVTCLAFDRGSLFVGGLNKGLFRIDPVLGQSTPVLPDEPGISALARLQSGRWAIGATTGYLEIEPDGALHRKLTKDQGLIHNNVTAVTERGQRIYAATAAGLSAIEGSGVRSIYAFHGLVNNHLYALSADEQGVWVGTLGGLCRVGGATGLTVGRCVTEKQGLAHPWVTALLNHQGALFVGTYGGGVQTIDSAGKLAPVKGTPTASINLNAACIAGPYACFGSLEHGLLLAHKTDKLRSFTQGLPSINVTALACDGQRLAVGTDEGLAILALDRLFDPEF